MIAHFVDCTTNFGDVLYPFVLERALRALGVADDIQRFSFLEGNAPLDAGYVVKSIQDLVVKGSLPEAKALLIGGGALLRASQDKERGYFDLYLERRLPLPAFFWQKQRVFRLFRRSYFNKCFAARFMNYPSVGPYIINAQHLCQKVPVAFCSCGGTNKYPEATQSAVRDAMERSSFIYLRDEVTRQHLAECGVRKEMYVAPDLICLLGEFLRYDEMANKGRSILRAFRVDTTKKVFVFQSHPLGEQTTHLVLTQLAESTKRHDCEVCLLPLGYCHNDHSYLESLLRLSHGTFKYLPVKSIYDMIAVITAGNVFIGTSMHGNIAAFSYGRPFLIGPTRRQKQQGFLKAANLDLRLQLDEWSQMADEVGRVLAMQPQYFSDRLADARKKTHAAVLQMLKATKLV